MTQTKMSFALRGGVVTHISEVRSGKQIGCVCPECKKTVVAKKGKVIRHHFAHDHGTACSLESVYHTLAKMLIYENTGKSINAGKTVPLRWKCELCGDEHTGILIKVAKVVKLENSLGPTRPDVSLFDGQDAPIVAIEVVVSHPPEQAARDFYREKNITLLTIKIELDSHIEALRRWERLDAESGTLCLRKKCSRCGQPLMSSPLQVVIGDCYRCKRPMKIAFKRTDYETIPPEDFSENEIDRARAEGCILEERDSDVKRARYLANVCANCGAFTGSFYLYEYTYLPNISKHQSSETYYPKCDRYVW